MVFSFLHFDSHWWILSASILSYNNNIFDTNISILLFRNVSLPHASHKKCLVFMRGYQMLFIFPFRANNLALAKFCTTEMFLLFNAQQLRNWFCHSILFLFECPWCVLWDQANFTLSLFCLYFFFYIDHRKLTKLSPPIIKETWSWNVYF